MAEPLKTFFSPALVRRLANNIARADATFTVEAFVRDACRDLHTLELLARGRHIANALGTHLPAEYPRALEILLASLGPEHARDELVGGGMAPFFYLPFTILVADRGLDHFDLSMRAQYELTKRFTAEFSIRPYIAKDPERAFSFLSAWATDENAHVRRLVSEGTRVRLPWGVRVRWLDQNPERVLSLLEMLKDDPSSMVRRSVANNLNDLGKVRPDLLVRTAQAWLTADATPERRMLVEHALRGAIKRGDAAALTVLGYGRQPKVSLQAVAFVPRQVPIGERVKMTFRLKSTVARRQQLLVDVAVHFVKARGTTGRKVFKLGRFDVGPHEGLDLKASFSLEIHTTRVPRPGRHAVDVIVNGHVIHAGAFEVVPGDRRTTRSSDVAGLE